MDEYFDFKTNKNIIKKKFNKFLNNLNGRNFYIKHPRAKLKDNFNNKKIVNVISKKILDDFIIDNLFTKYNKINLYAFPVSTVQLNLEKFKQIKNILILTENLPQRARDGMKTIKKYSKVSI